MSGQRRTSPHSQPIAQARYTVQPKPYTGPRAEDVLLARQTHLSAGQYHFYTKPLMLVEASMQYCFDDKAKMYVDCYSNVCHVGHCHPHFVNACSSAMHNIISNTRYLHPTIVRYAEKLKSKLPPALSVCYFVNSGSEANDLAMRLARIHTGRKPVVCLEHAYHGTTSACTGISTSLSTGTTKGTQDYHYNARDVYVAPVPDPYRGKYRGSDPHCGKKYAAELEKIISSADGGKIAAFIHESVQGVGGQVVYPQDFLKRAYAATRAAGGVCIADEVQTGFGRTGTHFWAFEAQDVIPDIVTLGKPIGNGFPLGAVITTREIARSFDGVQYFNTNGGNPVACSAGLAVLEIIERDRLQENALDVSTYLMAKLQRLKDKYPLIGDIRGVGLFIGIELVRDRTTLEPAKEETALVMERCRDMGLLVGKGGAFNNVIRIKPPLCFNRDDADFVASVLDAVIPDVATSWKARRSEQKLHGEAEALAAANVYVNCQQSPSKKPSVRNSSRHALEFDEDDDDDVVVHRASNGAPAKVPHNIPRHLAELVQRSSEGPRGGSLRQSGQQKRDRSPSSSSDEGQGRRSAPTRSSKGSKFALPK